jgi:hypothetical protein
MRTHAIHKQKPFTTKMPMKIYRVQIPASVYISVPAESEKQAKRIAAAVTYTDTTPLWGCDDKGSLGVSVWVANNVQDDPEKHCEALEETELTEPPMGYALRWIEPLRKFAELNNNTAELEAALR